MGYTNLEQTLKSKTALNHNMPAPRLDIKRAYEVPSKDDDYRVLVDRLWPRGLSKENADIDLWMRDVAPSNKLREWFSHDPAKWQEFIKRYEKELKNSQEFDKLVSLIKAKGHVTLIYGAKDIKYNQAAALKLFLEEKVLSSIQ